jgi:predicted molibdopterin-dependent oxidoreductase YjgC
MAAVLARNIGTNNISAAGDPSDIEAAISNKWSDQSPRLGNAHKIVNVSSLLIIGDILTRSAVLSKYVNAVKYGKRGNQIIVIDPNTTHTSWFATDHLKNKPGTEALVLASILKVISDENNKPLEFDLDAAASVSGIPKAAIIKTAKRFDDAENGTILFAPSIYKQRNDLIQYYMDQIASQSIGKKHMTFYSFGNTLGVTKTLDEAIPDHLSYGDIDNKIRSSHIKALLIIGDEAYSAPSNLDFVIRAGYFDDEALGSNTVLLPLASHLEKKGSVIISGGRSISLNPIIHNIGSKSYWKTTSQIIDSKFGYDEIIRDTEKSIRNSVIEPADIHNKIKEALSIKALDTAPIANITHFGNNEHVKHFFWWRANNNG